MSSVRLIKRYANRKLYDTGRSCYVTLDEIGEMIREGVEIRIIDNQTKEDLTSVTMAQILLEEEKRQRRDTPLAAMRQLIGQSGERLQRRITEPVQQIRSGVEELQARLDERVKHLVGNVSLLAHLQRDLARLRERLERIEAHLGIDPPPDEQPEEPKRR
jgi:polyhydroxyalkanoate synthesis repressor PhaR